MGKIMKKLGFGLLSCLALSGCSEPNAVVGGHQIEGNFRPFVNLRKNSLDRVIIDVYEDFACPACQHLETTVTPWLTEAYGDRIEIRRHYLSGTEASTSAMVLYKVATAKGDHDAVAQDLFRLGLDFRNTDENDSQVLQLARTYDLEDDFLAAMDDPSIAEAIEERWRTDGANIAFFPSVVIENAIVTTGDPDNIVMIVNSLLSDPMRQIRMSSMAKDGVEGRMIIE